MGTKIRYTIPQVEQATDALRVGLDVHEGDRSSRSPGELFGSMTLLDSRSQVVFSRELEPAQLVALRSFVDELKAEALKHIGAAEFEEPEPEPES